MFSRIIKSQLTFHLTCSPPPTKTTSSSSGREMAIVMMLGDKPVFLPVIIFLALLLKTIKKDYERL